MPLKELGKTIWAVLTFFGLVLIPWGIVSWLFTKFIGNLYIAGLIEVNLDWGTVFWMIAPVYLPIFFVSAVWASLR